MNIIERVTVKLEQKLENKISKGENKYSEKLSNLRTYYNGFSLEELEITRLKLEEMDRTRFNGHSELR